jgi:hypothetical protein
MRYHDCVTKRTQVAKSSHSLSEKNSLLIGKDLAQHKKRLLTEDCVLIRGTGSHAVRIPAVVESQKLDSG